MIAKILKINYHYQLKFQYVSRDLFELIDIIPGAIHDSNDNRIWFFPKSQIENILLPFKEYNVELFFTSHKSVFGDRTNIDNKVISLTFGEEEEE